MGGMRPFVRVPARVIRLAFAARYLERAELLWLLHCADLRGDVDNGDAYRIALQEQEGA